MGESKAGFITNKTYDLLVKFWKLLAEELEISKDEVLKTHPVLKRGREFFELGQEVSDQAKEISRVLARDFMRLSHDLRNGNHDLRNGNLDILILAEIASDLAQRFFIFLE